MPVFFLLKRVLCLSFFIVSFSVYCLAQTVDFDNYTPLVSIGNLPSDLTTTSTEKYKINKKRINRKERRSVRKLKKTFYLESAFSIDELLRSGKVLYNDPVGNYVNSVFTSIKKSAGLNDSATKLYIIKTNYSNAFATDQGYIFVTTGLIARLKNEAQLASVLCHELIHFIKKHSMDIFLKKNTSRNKNDYLSDFDFLARAAYSKEKESEADVEGFKLFLKTDYRKVAALTALDVLHYSHLPFENVVFDKGFLGGKNIVWSNNFFLEKVDSIFLDENTNDSFSTHPNIYERKKKIKAALDSFKSNTLEKKFINSEKRFLTIREICRYEFCRLALLEAKYADAIYAAYILLKKNPDSKYLKKIVAKALYSISTYCNNGSKGALDFDFKERQGESQQVKSFFKSIYAYEANVLAVKYLWVLKKKYPNDVEVNTLFSESIKKLTLLHYPDIEVFKKGELPTHLLPENDHTTYKNIKNYDSTLGLSPDSLDAVLRQQRIHYAFSGFLNDTTFTNKFKNAAKNQSEFRLKMLTSIKADTTHECSTTIPDNGEVNPNYYRLLDSLIAFKKNETSSKKNQKRALYSGNFNSKLKKKQGEKVILYNPIYYSIDERKEIPLKLIASEKTRETFISRLKISAKAANIPISILTDNSLSSTDAEKINNISLINDWVKEFFLHENIEILPTDLAKINELRDSLGSDYLCVAGNLFKTIKKHDIGYHVMISILVPLYSWPYTIPYLLSKKIETDFFMVVINLKERRIIQTNFNHINSRNKKDISLSTFYDFFSELKINQEN